jgi:hypothetical protein
MKICPGPSKVLFPRMKVRNRPSGDKAGDVAESAKLVTCAYSARAAAGRKTPQQGGIAASPETATVAPIQLRIERNAWPSAATLNRFPAIVHRLAGFGDLNRDFDGFGNVQASLRKALRERRTIDEFENQCGRVAVRSRP